MAMETNIKQAILDSFSTIYEEARGSRLQSSALDKLDKELAVVSDYFGTNRMQSFFTAVIFAMNYGGKFVDLNDFVHYLDCNPIRLLENKSELDELYNKGILEKSKVRHHRMHLEGSNEQYCINKKVTEAILQNKPLPVITKEEINDVLVLLEEIYNLGFMTAEGDLDVSELYSETEELIKRYLHFPLIKKIKDLDLSATDRYLMFYVIWKSISGRESTDISAALECLFDVTSQRFAYAQSLMAGENDLLKNDYLELVEASFFNDNELKLGSKSIQILADCDIKLFGKNKKKDNIIYAEDIRDKLLIFNEGEMKQLDLLKGLLEDKKFNSTVKRLEEKGLTKGFNVLLHGVPGTGKTETVLQLAKATDRDIMKVDISQSKSMWFGESEKVIKKIFTDYKILRKDSKITPILFFNEADAIISKRRNIGSSSVSQTENAIQNIILEELENFEGILIATTNLAKNMDIAFERRFLFKVEFRKPDLKTKMLIWLDKMSNLKEAEAEILAKNFDFSGAHIENVVRKHEIHQIINGEGFDFNLIQSFCEEEMLVKHSKIGF